MSQNTSAEGTGEGLYHTARPAIRRSALVLATRALLLAAGAVTLGAIVDRAAAGAGVGVAWLWLGGLLLGAAALGWLWVVLANDVRGDVEGSVRSRVLDVVIRHPAGPYRTGEVTARATEGAGAVGILAGKFLPQLIGGIVIPLLICAVVATIDVPTAVVLLVTVPAIPLLLRGMERRFTSVTNRYRETADRLTSRFFDGIQGMPTLRSLDAASRYGEALATDSDRLRGETMALLRVNQLALLIVDSLFTLGTVVVAGVAAVWRLDSGALSVGEAVAIVILGVALIEPIAQIGRFFYVGAIGRAAAKDVKGFLEETALLAPFRPGEGGESWVRVEEVSFSYDPAQPVVESVTFEANPGESIGLVGPSGSGKTTIAGLVAGLLSPVEGRVVTGGRVAMVAQRPFVFYGSLRQNLLLADPAATDEELWRALETAELADLARGRPEGLDLQVGERGTSLSGGEAQRLTIARLVLADAPILVLDEPTSNVDIETETRIRHALRRLVAGKTVLIIAHRRSTLADVQRVLAVRDGSISEMVAP